MSTAKKVLLRSYHIDIVWIDRDLFGKPFESAWQENYLLYVYPGFTSEISLVISSPLHDWFTFLPG